MRSLDYFINIYIAVKKVELCSNLKDSFTYNFEIIYILLPFININNLDIVFTVIIYMEYIDDTMVEDRQWPRDRFYRNTDVLVSHTISLTGIVPDSIVVLPLTNIPFHTYIHFYTSFSLYLILHIKLWIIYLILSQKNSLLKIYQNFIAKKRINKPDKEKV